MENKQENRTYVPILGTDTPEVAVTRKFVSDENLADVLKIVLENQLDTMLQAIYDDNQANDVTSQITQNEGEEM